jgi:hypothetical protein
MKNVRGATMDEKIIQSLLSNCQYFVDTLGNPAMEGGSIVFPQENHPFVSFRARYTEERKFLGKIYAMVIESKVAPGKRDWGDQRAELFYRGILASRKPFFKLMKGRKNGQQSSAVLVEALNGSTRLLDASSKLDLEYLKVSYDQEEEIWNIHVRPYGGSLVHLMFPPVRYNVMLPKNHAEGIMAVMKLIAALLKEKI